tara:strand:- start:57 stop:401 length:345 start_codon:yes stop_codon:yes gene_type:complete
MATTKSKKSTKKVEYKQQEKKYLAFMYVGGGSSWYQGTLEPEHAALKCVKQAKQDWKSLYTWKPETKWYVSIFDITNCKYGWSASTFGIFPILKNGKSSRKRKLKHVKTIKLFY